MNPQNACLLGAGLGALWPALLAAQQIDPSRLGEATRPLSVPSLRAPMDSGGLGLEDENPFAVPSPGDDDIGQQMILKESPRDRIWGAQADAFLYWTDNPANLAEGGDDDFFWGGRVNVTAQPRIGQRLFGDFLVGQQIYRYDRYDFLDYEYFEASAGLVYIEPKVLDSILYVQGYFNRMTTDDFDEEIVNSFSIRAGIQKSIVFDRKNSLHINLMGDWDTYTDDDLLDRFEYVADLGYSYKIMRDLVLGASYRFTWYDYRDIDREDALNLFGLNVVWSPRKWLDVYASGSYTVNRSNLDIFDYESTTIGGGLGVRVRF